jgi:serine/threonine protein kinase
VTVHRVGEVEGCPYLVSGYVRARPSTGSPAPSPAARPGDRPGGRPRPALAHRKGVLHRDVSRERHRRRRRQVKLLDFGLANWLEAARLPRRRGSGAHACGRGCGRGAPRRGPRREPPRRADAARLLWAGAEAEEVAPELARTLVRAVPPLADEGAPQRSRQKTPSWDAGVHGPEIWRGEPATFARRVLAGPMLYELCSALRRTRSRRSPGWRGGAGAPGPAVRAARRGGPRPGEVIDRCLSRDPSRRYASGNDVRRPARPAEHRARVPEGNPYRGLHAFEASTRLLLRARPGDTHILDRLATEPFVLSPGPAWARARCAGGRAPHAAGGSTSRTWTSRPSSREHPVAALASRWRPCWAPRDDVQHA